MDSNIPRNILEEASTNILSVLSSGCLEGESLTLAATAFCSIQAHIQHGNPAGFLDSLVNLLKNDIYESCKLHICNGIVRLRTQYFIDNLSECVKSRETLLQNILEIVYCECSKLNYMTFLAFDTLDKVVSIISSINEKGHTAISLECLKPLRHIVMSNLENPIPGVRQKNCSIMQTLLSSFYKDLWEGVLPKVNNIYNVGKFERDIHYRYFLELVLSQLPWTMKSKYFLLRIITERCPKNTVSVVF